jgi:hypothetical protein
MFNEYNNTVGDIIVGEIYQIRRNEILINHNKNELLLPKSEQIFKERYKLDTEAFIAMSAADIQTAHLTGSQETMLFMPPV